MIFNRSRPITGLRIDIPDDHEKRDEWSFLGMESHNYLLDGVNSMKYADLDYAKKACNSDIVRYIIDHAPIENKHKRILVDIKVHQLRKGEYPCKPGWHIDGSVNPRNLEKKPELHHLFLSGKSALTEFVDQPLDININPDWDFAMRSRGVGAILDNMQLPVFKIHNYVYSTYDDSYFHRGACCDQDEVRLLIRVTETDIIEPRNRLITPDTY